MVKKLRNIIDPQLIFVEQHESAVELSNKAKLSLYKKSVNSGIPANILEEVYRRGFRIWNDTFKGTPEQFAFDRVNSFVAGGFAAEHLDSDLYEKYTGSEPVSKEKDDPSSRFIGTDSLTKILANDTPGQSTLSIIKRVATKK